MIQINIQASQHLGGDSIAFPEKPQQDVLGSHVGMRKLFGFLGCQIKHLFDPRCVGNGAGHLVVRTRRYVFFHLHLNGFEVQPHFFEDIDRNTLIQLDQAQEQMFGADIVVIEPIGLLTCQS